jgi:hypothetical protein
MPAGRGAARDVLSAHGAEQVMYSVNHTHPQPGTLLGKDACGCLHHYELCARCWYACCGCCIPLSQAAAFLCM